PAPTATGNATGTAGPVLGPDAAAMRFDDLLRDRQPEPRMGAELLPGWPLAVEPVEDSGQLVRRDAGPLVLDGDQHGPSVEGGADAYFSVRWTERDRVGDDVEENLGQPAFDAGDDKR